MNAPLLTAGCLGILIHASSHASPVPLPVAPSTLPPTCVWVPAIAYPFSVFAAPVLAYLPLAGMTAPPAADHSPAQAAGQLPNWFAPVPGWRTLASPAHSVMPLCLPAPYPWSP